MAEREPEFKLSEEHQPRTEHSEAGASGELDLQARLQTALNEVEQLRRSAEEYKSLAQRVQADFLNYKRRVESERQAQGEAVRAETIRFFLPVVDDLERALGQLPADAAGQSWVEGLSLIGRNLAASFERLGLERLGAEGEPFDPTQHEAVSYEVHPSHPEGHIATVYRPGYRLGERVVRPAQVVVARSPQTEHAGAPELVQHQTGPTHSNGGVRPADAGHPRNIEPTQR
jgi:molecular chaperone GrpE